MMNRDQMSTPGAPRLFFSIRSRVLLMFCLLFAGVIAIATYRTYERRGSDQAAAMSVLQARAELITGRQVAAFKQAEQLTEVLTGFGRLSEVVANRECPQIIGNYLEHMEQFASVFIADLAGEVICNPRPDKSSPNVSKRGYFQRALQSDKLVFGDAILGSITGKWVLPIARSFRNASGQVAGVLVVGIDLNWVNNEFRNSGFPPDARIGLVDSEGVVLARYPDPDQYVGKDVSNLLFYKVLIAQKGVGTAETRGFDDVERLYVFTNFARGNSEPIYLWIGLSKSSVYANADRQFAITTLLTLLLVSLTFGATWFGSERLLVRPISAIANAAVRLRNGDHQARTSVPHTKDEVGQLALAFDDMALSLNSKSEILRLNRALRTLSACNKVIVHSESESQLLDQICKTLVETGGFSLVWIGVPQEDEQKAVAVVARFGVDDGYLDAAHITWADTPRGRGTTGMAIRTGIPQLNQNFEENAMLAPWRAEATKRGFRSSSAFPLIDDKKVIGALTTYSGEFDHFTREEAALLEELASDISYGVNYQRLRKSLNENLTQVEHSLEGTIAAMAAMLELRDPYTAGHQRRVSELAVSIAHELGISANEIRGIKLAAAVHDIGKIQVPAEILSKPTRLTGLEYKLLQQHCEAGYDILKGIDFPWPVAELVRQHHERVDGSGYPRGLHGDEILRGAKILAVADVVEAMSSHRPYRPALGFEAAIGEIEAHRGTLYDPEVVDVCVRILREPNSRFVP